MASASCGSKPAMRWEASNMGGARQGRENRHSTGRDSGACPPAARLGLFAATMDASTPDDSALRALLAAGRGEEAAQGLQATLARAPGDARAWGLLALVRRQLGEPEAALEAAAHATTLEPGLLAAWLERAEAEARLGMAD